MSEEEEPPHIDWTEFEERLNSPRSLVDDLSEEDSNSSGTPSLGGSVSLIMSDTPDPDIGGNPNPNPNPGGGGNPNPNPNPGGGNPTPTPGGSGNTNITVKLGGEDIEVLPVKFASGASMTVLYRKTDRDDLKKENKLNDLFEKATRTRISKLDLLTMTLSEEDKLDDTYNIGIQVGKIKSHFTRYDMHDVMGIVYFGPRGMSNPMGTFDLFASYSTISEKEVALSNQWYNEYTAKDYYRQNLSLTLEFLENNTTTALWEKCLEIYEEYPLNQRGGPLMFLIIMKKLQSHTDSAVQYLTNSIKNMKITNFEGENVSRATSLIRGAHKRLKMISKVPDDYNKWILQIFQTSTVPEFNQSFAHIQREVEVVKPLLSGLPPLYPSVDDMVKMAEQLYLNLASENTWTGISNKANQSGFAALEGKKVSCWNCGQEGHGLKECTKPKNNELIEKRRKAFRDSKNKKKNENKNKDNKQGANKVEEKKEEKKGKFAPPTESEKNRRTIDGKPMYWADRIKRWVNDKRANPAVNAVTPAIPRSVPDSNSSVKSDQEKLSRELMLSNFTHSINSAMEKLVNTTLREY